MRQDEDVGESWLDSPKKRLRIKVKLTFRWTTLVICMKRFLKGLLLHWIITMASVNELMSSWLIWQFFVFPLASLHRTLRKEKPQIPETDIYLEALLVQWEDQGPDLWHGLQNILFQKTCSSGTFLLGLSHSVFMCSFEEPAAGRCSHGRCWMTSGPVISSVEKRRRDTQVIYTNLICNHLLYYSLTLVDW